MFNNIIFLTTMGQVLCHMYQVLFGGKTFSYFVGNILVDENGTFYYVKHPQRSSILRKDKGKPEPNRDGIELIQLENKMNIQATRFIANFIVDHKGYVMHIISNETILIFKFDESEKIKDIVYKRNFEYTEYIFLLDDGRLFTTTINVNHTNGHIINSDNDTVITSFNLLLTNVQNIIRCDDRTDNYIFSHFDGSVCMYVKIDNKLCFSKKFDIILGDNVLFIYGSIFDNTNMIKYEITRENRFDDQQIEYTFKSVSTSFVEEGSYIVDYIRCMDRIEYYLTNKGKVYYREYDNDHTSDFTLLDCPPILKFRKILVNSSNSLYNYDLAAISTDNELIYIGYPFLIKHLDDRLPKILDSSSDYVKNYFSKFEKIDDKYIILAKEIKM